MDRNELIASSYGPEPMNEGYSNIQECMQKINSTPFFTPYANVYIEYTYKLSSVEVYLFIFSQCDVKIVKWHQWVIYRRFNDYLVESCSCAFLTQRTCLCKNFVWYFLRPINIVTTYVIIFVDLNVVVVYNVIEKWMIYGYWVPTKIAVRTI